MVKLINFNEGLQKEDIDSSGYIYKDTFRIFDFMWNLNKKKRMLSRVPFMMARKLGLEPYDANKLLIAQVNLCNMNCWYCFVDDCHKNGKSGINKSVEQIVDEVVPYLDEHKENNILEISGGEPSLFPKFVYELIENFPQDYGLLFDTNLTQRLHKSDLINQKNVGFKFCLKGINLRNFEQNCGLGEKYWNICLENLRYMEESLDDYTIYLVDCIQNNEDLKDLEALFNNIKNPEKVELLKVQYNYQPVFDRLKRNNMGVPKFEEVNLKPAWMQLLSDKMGKKIDDSIYHRTVPRLRNAEQRYLDCLLLK